MTSKDAIEVGVNEDNQRSSLSTILPSPPPGLSQLSIPQEAAIGVVKGSVGCSALMGIGGMIYGALRAQPAILYGLQAGFNTFTFAFPIFAVREYVAIPVYNDLIEKQFGQNHIQSIHTHNLIPTTISGGLMGGAMSAYFAGRSKWLAGTRTYAVVCAGLQLASNELRFLKIKVITANQNDNSILPEVTQSDRIDRASSKQNKASNVAASSAALSVAGVEGSSSGIETSLSLRPKEEVDNNQPSLLSKTWNKISRLSPVQRISDDEYERKLLQRREITLQQLRELDERIAEEEKAHHKV